MRDQALINTSVLKHAIRRAAGSGKRAPGVLSGGSLWQKIAGYITQLDAADLVSIGDWAGASGLPSLLRLAQLCSLETASVVVPQINADVDDLDLGGGLLKIITSGGPGIDIRGIAGGTDGRWIVLLNEGLEMITLQHQAGTSVAANRIITPNGLPLRIEAAGGCAIVVWNTTKAKWRAFMLNGAHKLLGLLHEDAVDASPVRGDLIRANSTPAWERYAKGAAGWVAGWDANDLVALDRRVVKTTADFLRSSNTLADVTGLGFSVEASSDYAFEFHVPWSSAAGTTGINLSINGPASPAYIHFERRIQTTTKIQEDWQIAYDAGGASPDYDNSGNQYWAMLKGKLMNGSNAGTLIVRAASEVNGSQIIVWQRASGWIHKLP